MIILSKAPLNNKHINPVFIEGAGGISMNEKEGERLLFFNGTECSHCKEMHPLVGKLEKEEKVHVTELEVWHDSKNMALLQKLDNGNCGGIPFFFNEKTGKWLCGNKPYDELKAWALGK